MLELILMLKLEVLVMIFKKIVSYIELNFGGNVYLEKTLIKEKLPLYLSNKYDFRRMIYFEKEFLLIDCSRDSELGIISLEKHLKKILDVNDEKVEAILIFDDMTKYMRNKLLEKELSFVILGKQIFLPNLGRIFSEKRLTRYSVKINSIKKISPTTEALLIEMVCSNKFSNNRSELARKLDVSEMSISRAVKELESSDALFYDDKTDIKEFIKKIMENAKQIFSDPILKRIYVKRESISDELWNVLSISGDSALSKETMLINPKFDVYGITNKKWKEFKREAEEVPFEDRGVCVVELWKYQLPIKKDSLHPLALYIMFMLDNDERIRKEIEILLERYFEGLN